MFENFTSEKASVWLWCGSGAVVVGAVLAAVLAINLTAVNALMDTEFSTYIQYVITSVCVFIEAFGFVLMRAAWKEGRWGAAAVFLIATTIAFVNSCGNEATFYSLNFANKAHRLSNEIALAGDAAKEKSETEARLAKAGNIRPPAEVENAIMQTLALPLNGDRAGRTLAMATKNCTETRSDFYDKCRTVLALRAVLAKAADIASNIEKDKARLETLRQSQAWITSVGVTHPGTELVAKVANGIVDWRGGSEKDHVSPDLIEAFYIAVLVLTTQFFHLFLPFAFFGRSTKRDAAENGMTVDAPIITAESSSTPITTPTEMITIENNAANTNATVDGISKSVDWKFRENSVDQLTPAVSTIIRPVDQLVDDRVRNFVDRYCVLDGDHQEFSEDLHAAYVASIDGRSGGLRANHFTKKLRKLLDLSRKETHRAGQRRAVRGLRLNEDGRRLLTSTREPGVSAAMRTA